MRGGTSYALCCEIKSFMVAGVGEMLMSELSESIFPNLNNDSAWDRR